MRGSIAEEDARVRASGGEGTAPAAPASSVGVVAIGRNEGERLRACLTSAARATSRLVYVDSGSSDDSLAIARAAGAQIVELDTDRPFTAARARNAGLARLVARWPEVEFVQFVDGDCELEPGWIERGRATMADSGWDVVCGRRRERHPEHSPYNLLCDMEWDTPVGESEACGGDAMMRVERLRAVGGFAEDLIAGEEPELCLRIAADGGRILRLDAPMTIHDARMTRASQWWTRAVRAGHAEAEAARRHPGAAGGRAERAVRSAWVWGGLLPLGIAGLAVPTGGASLWALAAYPLQILRIAWRRPRPNFSARRNLLYAAACVLAKAPHLQGVLRYQAGRLTGRRSRLIEYKGVS